MCPGVLVTNGEYQQALAITRSLGRRGIAVHCVSTSKRAVASRSRYCQRGITLRQGGESTGELLLEILEKGNYDAILPVGLEACWEASRLREEMSKHARVPVPDLATMEGAVRKHLTVEIAERVGVPVPVTARPADIAEAETWAGGNGYPVVVKGDVGSGGREVVVARDPGELRDGYGLLASRSPRPMVQEYVPGTGWGYSALASEGEVLAESGHRRLHEYPLGGGSSTMARATRNPEIMGMGRRMLGAMGWTGVAMVEFRGSPGTGFRLMEVNPKFWGSLDLSIASGVDYPYLAYRLAMGLEIPDRATTRDVTFRWLSPDLRYSLEAWEVTGYIRRFLYPSVKSDLDMDDPGPGALVVRGMLSELWRHLRS